MLNIVILAAGKSSRMNSSLPKVLHSLAGEPLLGHVVRAAKQLLTGNNGRIRVVTGHGREHVDPFVESLGCEVVHQEQQLGTGHALQVGLKGLSIQHQTLVLYGDVPLIRIPELVSLLELGQKGLAVLTAELPNPTGYGRIVRNAQGEVAEIVEQKDSSLEESEIFEVNSGVYAGPTALFVELLARISNNNIQNEYYLTDCVRLRADSGRKVSAALGSINAIMGVNDRTQLAMLNQAIQKERREVLMSQGVSLVDPSTVYINSWDVLIEPDTIIEPNVTLNGPITIGREVEIGFGCHITKSTIGPGTVVKPYSVMDSVYIGSNAQVGPFSRLRPGTEMHDSTNVGNFCEIKNAVIGDGTKINHLSYIGDAVVGQRANIGAGTITCNYDGITKNKTIMGDDVFLGSNTSLVAPIILGDRVTTGAGSVITDDVDADHLALSRVRQFTLAGYKRPQKKKD